MKRKPRHATWEPRTPPTILERRLAARSRYFSIESLRLRFANGGEREFERIGAPDSIGTVIVVAACDSERVLLVREYAVGLGRYEIGLPMGAIEPGESIFEAAQRELREETGFSARKLQHVTTLSLAPCILSFRASVVHASDLVAAQAGGDEPEAPEVLTVRLQDVEQLIAKGKLTEARSIAALLVTRGLSQPQIDSPQTATNLIFESSRVGGVVVCHAEVR